MYYVRDYYTQKVFGVFDDFEKALELAKKTEDSEIIDANGHYLFENVVLPF